jgi:hypothetical protein
VQRPPPGLCPCPPPPARPGACGRREDPRRRLRDAKCNSVRSRRDSYSLLDRARARQPAAGWSLRGRVRLSSRHASGRVGCVGRASQNGGILSGSHGVGYGVCEFGARNYGVGVWRVDLGGALVAGHVTSAVRVVRSDRERPQTQSCACVRVLIATAVF